MSSSNLCTDAIRNYDEDDPQADQILQSMEHLRIPKDQLQFDEPRQALGRGGFGIVERAVFHAPNTDPIIVAVKRIPARSASLNRLKKRTGREIFIWSKLSHANIIPFLGYEWNEAAEEVWLVCPWQAKGTVRDYLKASLAGIELRLKLIIHTAEALNYLHNLNPPVCHGDIKAANVLITGSEDAMLTDFGLSRMLDDSLARLETTHQFRGSIPWCSPELFEEGCIQTPASDVWAWAWLVHEIITGKVPFSHTSNWVQIVSCIWARKWIETPPDASFDGLPDLWDSLILCWDSDPVLRVNMSQCLSAVKALKPPQKYVVPELTLQSKSSESPLYDHVAPRSISSDQESITPGETSDSCLEADIPSHQESNGHLAPPGGPPAHSQPASTPPRTGGQSPSSRGRRPHSPSSPGRGIEGASGDASESASSRGRKQAGSRSPSPSSRTQGIQPNLDLRDTGKPRNLTPVLSKHQWSSLRKYDDSSSIFRTSLTPNSQVMVIVCVREVYRTKDERKTARTRLKKELTQHRQKLSSPNIAHWAGFGFVSPWKYACLVHHQGLGSRRLNAYLAEHPSANRFDIVKQVANGLECLHTNGVVHGDLHTHTIVVNAAGTVQVTGFGIVEMLGVAPEDLFTVRISPLEVLQGSPPTTASDVYAFAGVALVIFTDSQPFVKIARDTIVLGALRKGGYSKADNYPNCPKKALLWALFKRCWERDPAIRPVMTEVNETLLQIAKS